MINKTITIVCNPNQVVLVNDVTFRANDHGVIELNAQEVLVSGDRGLREFDRVIEDTINEKQRIIFYEMLLSCNRFGQNDVMGLLSLDKNDARHVLLLAFRNKLIKKYDTQWRTEHTAKEEIRSFVLSKKRQGMIKERVEEPIAPVRFEPMVAETGESGNDEEKEETIRVYDEEETETRIAQIVTDKKQIQNYLGKQPSKKSHGKVAEKKPARRK